MTEDDLNLLVLRSRKRARGWLVTSICSVIVLLLLRISAIGAEPPPLKFTHLGEWPGYARLDSNGIRAQNLVMAGTHGYVHMGGAFRVVDFSVPERPVAVNRVPSEASGFAVSGPYLYEAGRDGFRILDISNRATPVPLGSAATPTDALGVAVSGRYAYVTAGTSGLYVIDINDPAKPLIVGRLESNGGGREVAVAGNDAYVTALSGSAFEVINVSDPAKPLLAKAVATTSQPTDLTIEGNHLYLAGSSLEIFDIADPSSPSARGKISLPAQAADIQVWDGRVYVAIPPKHPTLVREAGVLVFDVSDEANPMPLGQYATDGAAVGLWLQGDYVYVAASLSGAQVVDFSDPANPRLVGGFETSGYSQGIAISQGHAFLAESFPAMRSVNVTDPGRPVLADTLDAATRVVGPRHITVSGDYAYLLAENGDMGGVSIVNPTDLTSAGFGRAKAGSAALRSAGDYLYMPFGASGCANELCDPMIFYGGFTISEITSFPGDPESEGQYVISFVHPFRDVHAWDVAVVGNYAYVAHTYKLAVVDVSDPAAPVPVRDLPLDCWRVAVSGGYAYVAGRDSQALSVVDIREPFAPFKVGEVSTRGGLIFGMAVAGQYLYLSSSGLVEVFDLSDPEKPVSVGSAATKGEGLDLAVEGNLIYVADGLWGLQIFQVEPLVRLEAELAGTELRLRWAADASNYILQSTPTLSPPQWEPVGAAPQVQDGFNVVKLPASSPAAFFQLLRP